MTQGVGGPVELCPNEVSEMDYDDSVNASTLISHNDAILGSNRVDSETDDDGWYDDDEVSEEIEKLPDNIPVIRFPVEVRRELCRPWRKALIVTLLEKTLRYSQMRSCLNRLWNTSKFKFIDVPNNYFIVRFEEGSPYRKKVLNEGPWIIMGHYLVVQRWKPEFDAFKNTISKLAVWVRFPNLPVWYYNSDFLGELGNKIGRSLKVDINPSVERQAEEFRVKGKRCVRLGVEIDLREKLVSSVIVQNNAFSVEYERLEPICIDCGYYGHKKKSCPHRRNQASPTQGASTKISGKPQLPEKKTKKRPEAPLDESGGVALCTPNCIEQENMPPKADKEHLNQILGSHLCTIHETLQVLDQAALPSSDKMSWEEIIKMGDQVSKQATIAGMLWTGEKPEVKAMEETMTSYFNTLQGFLLLSHGSKVGAGPTLSSCIHASVKQVVDSSFRLMKKFVSLYGSQGKDQQVSISQLVGMVWEACSALKKTPTTNITAIGRGMTQVAVSMKDVLRELRELKPDSSDVVAKDTSVGTEGDSDGELGNDLSPSEMIIARAAIVVVSDTLSVIKELIRSITGLLKLEKPKDNSDFVDSLEKLLKLCQELGLQIDEIGACLYPPQEVPLIEAAMEKIHTIIDDIQGELGGLRGASDIFVEACNVLRSSLGQLASELRGSITADLEAKVENITLSN